MLFDEPLPQIQARLSRWVKQGEIIKVRRGIYVLRPEQHRQDFSIYYVSNYLYRPSYVSLSSALEFHGLIPEAVAGVQAVTTRSAKTWETHLGRFQYYSLSRDRFWGYREYTASAVAAPPLQSRYLMARPEKSLLDWLYVSGGEWTEERIGEMRFQDLERLDRDGLLEAARRFKSPRVLRAVRRLSKMFFGRKAS